MPWLSPAERNIGDIKISFSRKLASTKNKFPRLQEFRCEGEVQNNEQSLDGNYLMNKSPFEAHAVLLDETSVLLGANHFRKQCEQKLVRAL